MTRIFFTTDVHGSDRCFRKFLNAAKVYKASCLILGGDITGKVLIPIVEREGGKYEAHVFGERALFGKEKVEETRKRLQDAGQYSFVTTKAELAEIQSDKAREDAVFNGAMVDVLRSWMALAQERLKGTGSGSSMKVTSLFELSGDAPTSMHWSADAEITGVMAGLGSSLLKGFAAKKVAEIFEGITKAVEAAS